MPCKLNFRVLAFSCVALSKATEFTFNPATKIHLLKASEVWVDLEKYTMIEGCPPRLLDQLLPTLLHNMALAEEDLDL